MSFVTEVSDEEVNSLTQSILVRYGIDFTCYEPKSLKRRIIRVLNLFNMSSIHELWVRFLHDTEFVHEFMNQISVGMTSMFRDPILWRNLKSRMASEYKTKDCISIWHAGCSSGEEVYSLAILLKEIHLLSKAKALATDFNKNAIEEAKKGEYHKIKMIENENNYKAFNKLSNFNEYYNADGKHAVIKPELNKHVTFQYQNLITDDFATDFDIIFCRNVMIYFDTAAKIKLLHKFYAALKPGGYLVIGFFDTMSHLMDNNKFNLVDDQAKVFQRS